ncbi:MAG: marR [Proteobacteria bacterium]|nr:marR [Pseudomonadota bacterium]
MTDIHPFYQAETYRVEESVGYLINRLAQTVARELDRRMADLGLTDAQWKPLLMLHQGECSTAADLSRMACHDTGAVTRLLDRLEAKGLIRRLRSAEDRRVVNLELTEAGEKIAAEVPKIIIGLANQVLVGFSPDEFAQFKDLLGRALLNARALSEADASC